LSNTPGSVPSASPGASILPRPPGTLLNGRYRIERLLGEGAFGRVYLARDTQDASSPLRAIKELLDHPSCTPDDKREAIAWFKREVGTLLTLEHPSIPAIYGYWTTHATSGPFYLAMAYIPGRTFDQVLQDAGGRIPWPQVVAWGSALCDVLAYLHSQTPPFIFRDLKLPNVMLDDRTNAPTLIDFGIARPFAPIGGTAIGTWGYVPYEQVLGKAEPRSDQYALGALLHALLTGRRPDAEYARLQRTGLDVEGAMRALFPPVDTLVPGVPAVLAAVLTRATAFAAADRFADIRAMEAALQRVVTLTSTSTLPASARTVAPPVTSSSGPPFIIPSPPPAPVPMAAFPAGQATRRTGRLPRPFVAMATVVVMALAGGLLGTVAGMAVQHTVAPHSRQPSAAARPTSTPTAWLTPMPTPANTPTMRPALTATAPSRTSLRHTGPGMPSGPPKTWSPTSPSTATSTPYLAQQWLLTASMRTTRVLHTATLLPDGRVLVVGGQDTQGHALASAELYDPHTGTWMATGSMIDAHVYHTATLLPNGKVLIAGGCLDNAGLFRPCAAELYEPSTGRWKATGSMSTGRRQHTATLLQNGKVLVAGGCCDIWGHPLSSAELYDPSTGRWTATGNMTTARIAHTATLLSNGKVLVSGGCCDPSDHTSVNAELYDPRTGTWAPTGRMSAEREDHTATLLPDGKVLVSGGPATRAELYDPSTGTWTTTGGKPGVYEGDIATLLPTGQVLVAGGCCDTAELYDLHSGTWSSAGHMNFGRSLATATLLPNGTVLVVGGQSNAQGSPALASAELYQSSTSVPTAPTPTPTRTPTGQPPSLLGVQKTSPVVDVTRADGSLVSLNTNPHIRCCGVPYTPLSISVFNAPPEAMCTITITLGSHSMGSNTSSLGSSGATSLNAVVAPDRKPYHVTVTIGRFTESGDVTIIPDTGPAQ
jgi:serine/threonine protein kinase